MDNDETAPEVVLPIDPQHDEQPQQNEGGSFRDRMREFMAAKDEETAPKPEETPAEKPETTPEQPNPGEQADPDAPKEPKAKAKWGELKKAKEEYEAFKTSKLPAMEKELEELRAERERLSKVDPVHYEKQLAERDKAIADYEKRIAVVDIQKSKQFKESVEEPLQKIGAASNRLASMYGINAEELSAAFTIADPKAQFAKLTELMTDFDPIHKAKVYSMVEEAQGIFEKANTLEQNALEAKKEMDFLNHQESEKQKGERIKKLTVSAEAVKKQMLEHLPFLKDEAIAKDVFSASLETDDPTDLAYSKYSGRALVHAIKDIRSKEAKIRELEDELAKRAKLGVKAGGDNGLTTPAQKPALPEGNNLFARGIAMGLKPASR